MDEEYICFTCLKKYKYEADWSDDDAIKEYEEEFPEATKADMTLVCDDCYQKFTKGQLWQTSKAQFQHDSKSAT